MSVSYDDLKYNYIDPTGNITILVESTVPKEEYTIVSDYFCKKYPACEQVGFVFCDCPGADIRLQMAGGEFCGNATMSTGALFAKKSGLTLGQKKTVKVKPSGSPSVLDVEIEYLDENYYAGKVSMPSPIGFEYRDFSFAGRDYRLPMVKFQGMYHIIFDSAEVETLSKEAAEEAVIKWCEEIGSDGMGLMFLNEAERKLTPLVYVPALKAFYWENSCASGTTATGYYLYKKYKKETDIFFTEPGGELGIKVSSENEIYLSGHVRFTAV